MFPKPMALSGALLFSTNLFLLASLLALFGGLNFSFVEDALLGLSKITKVAFFASAEVFRKDAFLAMFCFLCHASSYVSTFFLHVLFLC